MQDAEKTVHKELVYQQGIGAKKCAAGFWSPE